MVIRGDAPTIFIKPGSDGNIEHNQDLSVPGPLRPALEVGGDQEGGLQADLITPHIIGVENSICQIFFLLSSHCCCLL